MARITSKGQVTIPVAVRRSLRLEEGDDLVFRLVPNGALVQVRKQVRLGDLVGALKVDRPTPDKAAVRDEVGKALGERRRPPAPTRAST